MLVVQRHKIFLIVFKCRRQTRRSKFCHLVNQKLPDQSGGFCFHDGGEINARLAKHSQFHLITLLFLSGGRFLGNSLHVCSPMKVFKVVTAIN